MDRLLVRGSSFLGWWFREVVKNFVFDDEKVNRAPRWQMVVPIASRIHVLPTHWFWENSILKWGLNLPGQIQDVIRAIEHARLWDLIKECRDVKLNSSLIPSRVALFEVLNRKDRGSIYIDYVSLIWSWRDWFPCAVWESHARLILSSFNHWDHLVVDIVPFKPDHRRVVARQNLGCSLHVVVKWQTCHEQVWPVEPSVEKKHISHSQHRRLS